MNTFACGCWWGMWDQCCGCVWCGLYVGLLHWLYILCGCIWDHRIGFTCYVDVCGSTALVVRAIWMYVGLSALVVHAMWMYVGLQHWLYMLYGYMCY